MMDSAWKSILWRIPYSIAYCIRYDHSCEYVTKQECRFCCNGDDYDCKCDCNSSNCLNTTCEYKRGCIGYDEDGEILSKNELLEMEG